MTSLLKKCATLSVLGLFAASPAWAQTMEEEGQWQNGEEAWEEEAWEEDMEAVDEFEEDETQEIVIPTEGEPARAQAQPNFALEVGGAFSNFTSDLADATDPGVGWELRGIFGASSPVGLEVAYFGSANSFENFDESVVSSAGELLGRVNLLPDSDIRPFAAAGVNYYRLDGTGDLDLFQNANESIGFPLSVGVNYYPAENFTIGARGTYRILTEILDDNFPGGNNWTAGLTLGAAF